MQPLFLLIAAVSAAEAHLFEVQRAGFDDTAAKRRCLAAGLALETGRKRADAFDQPRRAARGEA